MAQCERESKRRIIDDFKYVACTRKQMAMPFIGMEGSWGRGKQEFKYATIIPLNDQPGR